MKKTDNSMGVFCVYLAREIETVLYPEVKCRRMFFTHRRHFDLLLHAFLLANILLEKKKSRRKALTVILDLAHVSANMFLETADQGLEEESATSASLASE